MFSKNLNIWSWEKEIHLCFPFFNYNIMVKTTVWFMVFYILYSKNESNKFFNFIGFLEIQNTSHPLKYRNGNTL